MLASILDASIKVRTALCGTRDYVSPSAHFYTFIVLLIYGNLYSQLLLHCRFKLTFTTVHVSIKACRQIVVNKHNFICFSGCLICVKYLKST